MARPTGDPLLETSVPAAGQKARLGHHLLRRTLHHHRIALPLMVAKASVALGEPPHVFLAITSDDSQDQHGHRQTPHVTLFTPMFVRGKKVPSCRTEASQRRMYDEV